MDRKLKRTLNSSAFRNTDFTFSLNQKTDQAERQTYISSRREGVASSHKRDKKESIKEKENVKKQHYKVNFTTFLRNVNENWKDVSPGISLLMHFEHTKLARIDDIDCWNE
jgi:hypothetical protein